MKYLFIMLMTLGIHKSTYSAEQNPVCCYQPAPKHDIQVREHFRATKSGLDLDVEFAILVRSGGSLAITPVPVIPPHSYASTKSHTSMHEKK